MHGPEGKGGGARRNACEDLYQMSSLKERLKSAHARQEEKTSPILLPLSTVRDYLSRHVIVCALHLNPSDVHAAVLEVHRRYCDMQCSMEVKTQTPQRPQRMCFECHDGYIVLDAREGQEVCSTCGIVQTTRTINVTPEYQTPADVSRSRTKRIKDVPKWMLNKSLSDVQGFKPSKFWSNLQHYNAYVHLGLDDLTCLDKLLCSWTGGGFSSDTRMAAALLYLPLRSKFPTDDDIRQRVRGGHTLAVVETVVPEAKHKCETCGEMCHTGKEARFHCRFTGWGKKRKR